MSLNLLELRAANKARDAEWVTGGAKLSLAFRGNELAGEIGEACNVIKKLERESLGLVGSRATVEDLAEELADGVICIDLIAMDLGIDLGPTIVGKFNGTSLKRGLKTMLMPSQAADDLDPDRVAKSLASMLIEYVDGGINSGQNWRNGFGEIILARLRRHLPPSTGAASAPASGGFGVVCEICKGPHDNDALSDICRRCEDTAPWREDDPPPAGSVPAGEERSAWTDVLAERRRQVDVEGFDAQHDDGHSDGEIGRAAAAYALSAMKRYQIPIDLARNMPSIVAAIWPWEAGDFKPSGKPNAVRRSLVKAAALIIAEIERLDRADARKAGR